MTLDDKFVIRQRCLRYFLNIKILIDFSLERERDGDRDREKR